LVGAVLLPALLPLGPPLWIMLFLWGGTTFGIYTTGLALLGERFPRAQLAGANTAFVMIYECGSVGGPVIAGAAMDLIGRDGLVLTVGLASGAFLLFGLRRRGVRDRA
jgi:hypothetical protein